MSSDGSQASTKLVEEDIPCIDSGSLLKLYYNTFFREPFNGVKIVDDTPIKMVCSDVYCGKQSKQRVKENAAKLHYFCYRNRFSRLPDGTSTDTRWGCLARTGQMLLATALLRSRCDGGPTIGSEEAESIKSGFRVAFMDRPESPLGLHQIEEAAHADGAAYATWLSPTQLSVVLTAVVEKYRQNGGRVPHAICGKDRDINVGVLRAILDQGEAAILFIPLALGIEEIGAKYQPAFFELLDDESSCGVAGGVKKASYYFFGHQEKKVIYYDPHYVQKAYRSANSLGEGRSIYKMTDVTRLSPFMLTAFFIGSHAALDRLLQKVDSINKEFPFPLISITGRLADASEASPPAPPTGSSSAGHHPTAGSLSVSLNPLSPDEY